MSPLRESLFQQALRLDESERIALAEQLYASAKSSDFEIEAEWRAEIVKRIAEIERGEAALVDGDEVIRKVRSILRDNAA